MPVEQMFLGGFRIRNTTSASMTRFLERRIAANRKVAVGFANHHFITTCQALQARFRSPDMVLVNDGIGIQLAARLRFGHGFLENMNGTDFVPRFLRRPATERTVYLVGGPRETVRLAAEMIADLPTCRVVGFCDGFSLWQHEAAVLDDIATLAPDVLLVGLGNPVQERWILENWDALNAKVIIGVGALFEWMTGTRRRAPNAVRLARLEWAYRLLLEPRRLLKRYTWEAVQFFTIVFWPKAALADRNS